MRLNEHQKLNWLRLIRSDNVGPATFRELVNHFGSAEIAIENLPELANRIGRKKKITIASMADAEREMAKLHRIGGKFVALGEDDYPAALQAGDNPPPLLSVIGDSQSLSRNCISIVGSRNSSLSGVKLTRKIAGELGQANYIIVSGLARGIDTAAHQAALSTGTIAVFAGGIDHVYPSENENLLHDICENGGAAVSEMPFGWKPVARDFPRRNRIVAGMSLGLVVVEAAQRSGSLISARLANEMGRLVFAVPGSPLDPRSVGTNKLIQQGATLVTSAKDIVEMIEPLTDNPTIQSPYSLQERGDDVILQDAPSEDERTRIVDALGRTPVEVDEIIRYTGSSAAMVQLVLLELDLAGQLDRHGNNQVSLV